LNPQTIKRTSKVLKREHRATNSLFTLFHEAGHAGHVELGIELPYDEIMEGQERIQAAKVRRGIGDPVIEKYLKFAGQSEKHADSFAEAVLGSHTRLLSPYSTIGEIVDNSLSPYDLRPMPQAAIRLGQSRPDLRIGLNLYLGVTQDPQVIEQLVTGPMAFLSTESRVYTHQQKLMSDAYENTPAVIGDSPAPVVKTNAVSSTAELVSNPLEQPSVTNRIVQSAQERQKSRRISE